MVIGMGKELHLFIIWEHAKKIQDKILEDISRDLDIIKVVNVKWSRLAFAENLQRFYGTKLHRWSFKERECGNGPFTLVLVHDNDPKYENRKTSRGKDEFVNVKMFDRKQKYRSWLGGNNAKVHCTNSEEETAHDLMLLLGMTIDEFEKCYDSLPDTYCKNIIGHDGWDSLEQIFKVLNATSQYVVLRNYEYLPGQYKSEEHGDIDLLVYNEKDIAFLLRAKKIVNKEYRVHYKCKIGSEFVKFDFRYVGDGYYDEKWEKEIIKNRIMHENGFFTANKEDYKYSLLYHALIQKKKVSVDYQNKLLPYFGVANLKEALWEYLETKKYEITDPKDLSVFFNEDIAGRPMNIERKRYMDKLASKQRLLHMIRRK